MMLVVETSQSVDHRDDDGSQTHQREHDLLVSIVSFLLSRERVSVHGTAFLATPGKDLQKTTDYPLKAIV